MKLFNNKFRILIIIFTIVVQYNSFANTKDFLKIIIKDNSIHTYFVVVKINNSRDEYITTNDNLFKLINFEYGYKWKQYIRYIYNILNNNKYIVIKKNNMFMNGLTKIDIQSCINYLYKNTDIYERCNVYDYRPIKTPTFTNNIIYYDSYKIDDVLSKYFNKDNTDSDHFSIVKNGDEYILKPYYSSNHFEIEYIAYLLFKNNITFKRDCFSGYWYACRF